MDPASMVWWWLVGNSLDRVAEAFKAFVRRSAAKTSLKIRICRAGGYRDNLHHQFLTVRSLRPPASVGL